MQENLFTKAQASRTAIERLYIEMRHIFNSGAYFPSSVSGKVIQEALLTLSPEIYGQIANAEKVELDGLLYVIDRLPLGIESCRFIKLSSEEGYNAAHFEVIIPPKRRRNCYRIDKEQMFIEVTRGRSEIYDILTHLTFLYNEAEKIKKRAFHKNQEPTREWQKLAEIVEKNLDLNDKEQDIAFSYLSTLLGCTFDEVKNAYQRLCENIAHNSGIFKIVYGMGKLAAEEDWEDKLREVSFTPTLRNRIGRHIYGEKWADRIKIFLFQKRLFDREFHIISANLHSVMNILFASAAIPDYFKEKISLLELATELSKSENKHLQKKVKSYALKNGMSVLEDETGTKLSIQIFDTSKLKLKTLHKDLNFDLKYIKERKPVIIVMDYAFGEQAFETMDELLKSFKTSEKTYNMPVESISIMGKAGILSGGKGDIMIPTAHVFEGTADNYPFENDFNKEDFEGFDLQVLEGVMITVLGTSLQNRDVLAYFKESSWKAIGLEMEGAHYQKAIQAEAKIRNSIKANVRLRYAYYASDNPLLTGSTLASGSLGLIGVKPTYIITQKILEKIFVENKVKLSETNNV